MYGAHGQHDRNPFGTFRSYHAIQPAEVFLQNVAMQEQQGRQGLVLRRTADVAIHRQMRQKLAHLLLAHFQRMSINAPEETTQTL